MQMARLKTKFLVLTRVFTVMDVISGMGRRQYMLAKVQNYAWQCTKTTWDKKFLRRPPEWGLGKRYTHPIFLTNWTSSSALAPRLPSLIRKSWTQFSQCNAWRIDCMLRPLSIHWARPRWYPANHCPRSAWMEWYDWLSILYLMHSSDEGIRCTVWHFPIINA